MFLNRFLVPVVLAAFFLVSHSAIAQTAYTWTGATSSDWNTASNWNPNGIPGGNAGDKAQFGASARTSVSFTKNGTAPTIDSIVFMSGAPVYTLTFNSADTELTIQNGIVNDSAHRPVLIFENSSDYFLAGGNAADSSITNSAELLVSAPLATATIKNEGQGFVDFNNSASIDDSTATLISDAGTYVDMARSDVYLGSFSGAATIELCALLGIGYLNSNDVLSGPIVDKFVNCSGSLEKAGSGTLTLTGTSTFSGSTNDIAGTLDVEGSLASTGTVHVGCLAPGLTPCYPATLTGGGSVGNLILKTHSTLVPGDANPNTKLTMNHLACDQSGEIHERIGENGDPTYGTFINLATGLKVADCPRLDLFFSSAGTPMEVGRSYLVATMGGATDFTAGNLTYDFSAFSGLHEASGHFVVSSSASFSGIFFTLDSLGEEIFKNGFD